VFSLAPMLLIVIAVAGLVLVKMPLEALSLSN
jgi:uncharacterized BrkB/YihY/UPF0761 family membrane protein